MKKITNDLSSFYFFCFINHTVTPHLRLSGDVRNNGCHICRDICQPITDRLKCHKSRRQVESANFILFYFLNMNELSHRKQKRTQRVVGARHGLRSGVFSVQATVWTKLGRCSNSRGRLSVLCLFTLGQGTKYKTHM